MQPFTHALNVHTLQNVASLGYILAWVKLA